MSTRWKRPALFKGVPGYALRDAPEHWPLRWQWLFAMGYLGFDRALVLAELPAPRGSRPDRVILRRRAAYASGRAVGANHAVGAMASELGCAP